MSSREADVVGVSLGLIVGLVLVFWLACLFEPAFNGTGTPAIRKVATNLVLLLGTAVGTKWASKGILSAADYAQIIAPYFATVAIVFFGFGFVLLCVYLNRKVLHAA